MVKFKVPLIKYLLLNNNSEDKYLGECSYNLFIKLLKIEIKTYIEKKR